jgi:hypothetical protein
MQHRQRALDQGSKRYSIVLGPEFVSIVERQAKIWGSNNEAFRQALLALETNTSQIADPESGQTFAIESDHIMQLSPMGDGKTKLTFTKGD